MYDYESWTHADLGSGEAKRSGDSEDRSEQMHSERMRCGMTDQSECSLQKRQEQRTTELGKRSLSRSMSSAQPARANESGVNEQCTKQCDRVCASLVTGHHDLWTPGLPDPRCDVAGLFPPCPACALQ